MTDSKGQEVLELIESPDQLGDQLGELSHWQFKLKQTIASCEKLVTMCSHCSVSLIMLQSFGVSPAIVFNVGYFFFSSSLQSI